MPETLENMVEIAISTYDQLPIIADAFLTHAEEAGVAFDPDEVRYFSRLTFDSATITFLWCEPSITSHGINFSSPERDFKLWFEVRGSVGLSYGETEVFALHLGKRGHGNYEFEGDSSTFVETAKFVSSLSPAAFGAPSKVEGL